MSSLLQTIQDDLKSALKGGDKARTGALRFLISQIQYARIEKQDDLSDDDVLIVLGKQAKSRKESIEAFEKGGRSDLVTKEQAELAVIERYLPEQLSQEEIQSVLTAIVQEEGLSGMADFGKLMKAAMERLRGKADGGRVSSLAKETLGGVSD
jgi:uncharacterized protein YqeY